MDNLLKVELIDCYEPLSDRDLEVLENELGVKLPLDYRSFLSKWNGGRFVDGPLFETIDPIDESIIPYTSITFLFPFSSDEPDRNLLHVAHTARAKAWPAHLVPIGGSQDLLLFLDASGKGSSTRGRVLCLGTSYYAELFWYPRESASLSLVAHSFSEFIASLDPYKEAAISEDETSIFHAAEIGDLPRVQKFLAAGADPNLACEGFPLLRFALDRPYVVSELLLRGADPNARDGRGDPLIYKARSYYDSLKLLLDHGADPNLTTLDGSTALLETMEHRCRGLLLAAGADINVQSNDGRTMFSQVVRWSIRWNQQYFQWLYESGYDLAREAEPLIQRIGSKQFYEDEDEFHRVCDTVAALNRLLPELASRAAVKLREVLSNLGERSSVKPRRTLREVTGYTETPIALVRMDPVNESFDRYLLSVDSNSWVYGPPSRTKLVCEKGDEIAFASIDACVEIERKSAQKDEPSDVQRQGVKVERFLLDFWCPRGYSPKFVDFISTSVSIPTPTNLKIATTVLQALDAAPRNSAANHRINEG